MRMALSPRSVLIAALLAVAGCTTSPTAEVTRFNIGTPIPSDSIALVPGPGIDPGSLEFRTHAAIVARDLDAVGLHPPPADARAAYVGVLVVMQSVREGPPKPPKFSIGIGGGSYSGGLGVGGSVAVPVGKARPNDIRVNLIDLQIRRTSDSSIVWEGKAIEEIAGDAPASSLSEALPILSKALLTGFPGKNGETIKVKMTK